MQTKLIDGKVDAMYSVEISPMVIITTDINSRDSHFVSLFCTDILRILVIPST